MLYILGFILTFPFVSPVTALPDYSLPVGTADTAARSQAISTTRDAFNYGPDISGQAAFFPVGSYADKIIADQLHGFLSEANPWTARAEAEAVNAVTAVMKDGGVNTYRDYVKFYDLNLWSTTIPGGPAPGMLTNYTSDLLFSMERLSTQPYSVRRLGCQEKLSFTVDDHISRKLTGQTQKQLQSSGHLFYVDHRDQGNWSPTPGRYGAACDAFFYIHPETGSFLPLAIRPNNGSPLIYTPLDNKNDWQLAKMLFECNDFYFAQWYHLAATHEVVEIVLQAAIRTLSVDHPIYAVLNRIAYNAFVFRIVALKTLLSPGGFVDRFLAWNSTSVIGYTTHLYKTGGASFERNYFMRDLEDRGLINASGPPLKSFPFYEDATVIYAAIKTFFTSFVDSYYHTDEEIQFDKELHNFFAETKPAEIVDFPSDLGNRCQLVDLLTHLAYLTSVKHGVLNSNDPVHTSASLPLHPTAFYRPLPKKKGLTEDELVAFMPNITQSAGQIALLATFNRPFYEGGNMTLSQMFNQEELLARSNEKVRAAAAKFTSTMVEFSKNVVRKRSFDKDGLSQGMPFIWTTLDPQLTGFAMAV